MNIIFVYFDQQIGAAHCIHYSKNNFVLLFTCGTQDLKQGWLPHPQPLKVFHLGNRPFISRCFFTKTYNLTSFYQMNVFPAKKFISRQPSPAHLPLLAMLHFSAVEEWKILLFFKN